MGGLAWFFLALQGQGAASATLLQHAQSLSATQWAALLYLLLFASALAPAMQIWAQRYVPAVQSALIYGLEPVFAALMAYWWLGDTLTGWALVGAVLIVAALLLGQLSSSQNPQPSTAASHGQTP
jgi:drug/metabolite transporter (DMT)-like permease